MVSREWRILLCFLVVVCVGRCLGHEREAFSPHSHCDHSHHNNHHHHHHHSHGKDVAKSELLPEELAEEEDLRLYGHGSGHAYYAHGHEFGDMQLSGVALWSHALGCSFLVSMASLICLIILPLIFVQGKPSKEVVDSLALFGAGAMLGDAFLHQLPHAFGGTHSHSNGHMDHADHVHSGHEHSHAHTLKDLSVGMSILGGILLFLLIEKIVRYVEDNTRETNAWTHSHHHHHKKNRKLDDINDSPDNTRSQSSNGPSSGDMSLNEASGNSVKGDNLTQAELRKRKTVTNSADNKQDAANVSMDKIKSSNEKDHTKLPSDIVFGYLNLFSDGVHNFTDGMALGSAFMLYGSVGGWSRTLFLLAHELPQEVGDFGILVRSGFSVTKALFFNFLSALVALAGTAMALLMGRDPGQSSFIEGFTAGGFIYIAVAGVLAEMNSNKGTTLRSSAVQIISLMLGMAVALCISLVE